MTETNPIEYASPSAPSGEIVAKAATYYRVTRYIMVLVLFLYGLWSIRDGFYVYPRENAEAKKAGKDVMPHSPLDIPFNQFFGVVLPPLSILMLYWCLRKSRGEIRFDGKTLSAPGHPSVPLENIAAMDQRLWDRKGIAYVDYDLGAQKGRILLDDFIYEREPIDAIHDAIVKYIAPEDASSTSENSKPESA